MPGLFLRYLRLNGKREREAQLESGSWSGETATSPRGESIDDAVVLQPGREQSARRKSEVTEEPGDPA